MRKLLILVFCLLLTSFGSADLTVKEFNSDTSWTIPDHVNEIDVLVVGGGGGGTNGHGAGGGGGGVRTVENVQVSGGETVDINVGAGGAGGIQDYEDDSTSSTCGKDGESSVFDSNNVVNRITAGGGNGKCNEGNEGTVGATSGSPQNNAGGANSGGGNMGTHASGGGGGAGANGQDAHKYGGGNGGDGVDVSNIFDDSIGENGYVGGGGAGEHDRRREVDPSYGGNGGGGDSTASYNDKSGHADDGMPGTGGGGAGDPSSICSQGSPGCTYGEWYYPFDIGYGGDGGSGVVAVQYDDYQAPQNPLLESPSDGAYVGLDPSLQAYVETGSAPDFDYVEFRETGGTNLGTNNNVGTGSTSVEANFDSSDAGRSVTWEVEANDGTTAVTSGTRSFNIIDTPNNPNLVDWSDGAMDVPVDETLDIEITHPDSGQTNLDNRFQVEMDRNSNNVNTLNDIDAGQTVTFSPSFDYSQSYDINVIATDQQEGLTSQETWTLNTEHNTGLDSISGPANSPAPLNPELEATVSHSDPSEELTVDFVNDDNGNVICSQSGVTDTNTVTCDPSGEAFASSTGTNYNWRVDLSGDWASESYSSSVQSFDTVSAPTVSLSSPSDGAENVATDADLVADVSQAEGLQMNTVVTLEDDQGNFVDDYSVNSNPGQITFSDPNLKLSENYQWYADTSIVDSTYSQSDTSSTRSFSTEHDFRVDGVYPSDGREAVGVNDTIDVEVFHSSDRNIDVEFYFGDTASGTPNVTKTVTSSGSAVNATVDTENFDGFGEETGTTYNWSYVVSDGASDTSDITGEGLSFTTVYRPELSLDSPTDSETNVDIDGSLDIGVQQDDNIATGVTAQLNNVSGEESGVATDTVIGTGSGTTASFSLHNFDFVEAGETYSYNATGQINNPGDAYTIQSSTGLNTFTVSPKPEVTGIEPLDGETGTPANPLLNVTVDHDESDQMTVEFYNWAKTGSEALIGSDTVAAGDTASINISDREIGDSPQVYYWYVNVTTESGTSWSNQANPYMFTVASIGSVDYDANTESGVNLNPDNAADQGLDAIVGKETIVYQVSNDVGADMPGIGFNVSNGVDSEVFGEVDDVESGSSVTVDLGESSLIEEDQEGYEIYAFYQEAGTDFTGEDFRSDKIEFSTHVAEVEWVNPGQPGNQPINEYRVYHNNQSGQAFSNFDYVGSISDDDSGSFTAGVANLELGDSNSNECFRMVSWNVAGESNPTSEQCVGVVP